MYSACFSTEIQVAKLAQMGNFCLTKSHAMEPIAQMATSSASIDNPIHAFVSYAIGIYRSKFFLSMICILIKPRAHITYFLHTADYP